MENITFGSIYDDRLKDAKKLLFKVLPKLKDNSYDIKGYKFSSVTEVRDDGVTISAYTMIDNYGDKYIVVNNKFQKESLEALASLIAHELTHVLDKPTVDEEVEAYTNEALAWNNLKNDKIKSSELTEILNHVLELCRQGEIRNYVVNSGFYQDNLGLN